MSLFLKGTINKRRAFPGLALLKTSDISARIKSKVKSQKSKEFSVGSYQLESYSNFSLLTYNF